MLTEQQELYISITKRRFGNQEQLKRLRIKAEYIEEAFEVMETFETSRGIELKLRLVNFKKTYKHRFYKQNKRKKSHWDVNALQKSIKEACKNQPNKDERFEGACFFYTEKEHKFCVAKIVYSTKFCVAKIQARIKAQDFVFQV